LVVRNTDRLWYQWQLQSFESRTTNYLDGKPPKPNDMMTFTGLYPTKINVAAALNPTNGAIPIGGTTGLMCYRYE
jgi:hypothetical protein